MRIGILGPLDVRDPSGRPVEISGPRLRALLVRLALEPGRSVQPGRLLDDLWDGAPPAGGGNALQALVSRLRAATGPGLIEHGPAGYRLAVDPADVDAVAFERAVAAARTLESPSARAEELRRVLALWRGPALDGFADAPFAAGHSARLEELRLTAIEDRVDAELAAGADVAPLVPELEALADAHPLRERLRAQLMRALYAAGRQADALSVYEETRQALADHLGVDPSPELASVHLSILRQDVPERPAEPATGRARLTNLPAQFTSFVGREEESARLDKLLRESRLVMLTGPGGAGKTRLAAEAAGRAVQDMPDGVWFVALAPVADEGDGERVAQAALTALDIKETVRPGETHSLTRPLDRLADVLAPRRMILVLDNCEHLIEGAATVAGRILADAPWVRILATSREPLGITGESLCPVPSLALPPADADAAEALHYDSVRLFADRAAAVRPGFAVDEETVPHVVEICRALDGIPLAIELAAARLRSLTPAQVADRLGDRFRLLTGGSRTALPRHRTLRAVVDWSWDLLDDRERAVLRRLSVFAGGASPDAVTAVCGTGLPEDPPVIDVIAALVDKSLVMAEGTADVRYRLLETVRVYAAQRLAEAGETRRIGAAHAAYFLDLAERAEPELRRADQIRWTERLDTERGNWQAALRFAIDTGDAATGLRFISALFWYWLVRDQEVESGGWARAVRDIAGGTAPPGLEEPYAISVAVSRMVAEITDEAGLTRDSFKETLEEVLRLIPERPRHPMLALIRFAARFFQGDVPAAREALWDLKGHHPDPWLQAVAQCIFGYLAMNEGDLETAVTEARACYEGFHALGDRFGLIMSLGLLTELAMAHGDPAEAVRYGEEAHGYTLEGSINPDHGAAMLIQLARARAQTGDLTRARADLEQGIVEAERVGQYCDAASGRLYLAELARREGDADTAQALVNDALALIEPRQERPDFYKAASLAYSMMGGLAEQRGDLDAAESWHTRAFRKLGSGLVGDNQALAALLEGRATLDVARGDHARAAELLGMARTLRGFARPFASSEPSCFDAHRAEEAARAALGRDGFDSAYERGRRADHEEAWALCK
ncbi:SARP family transcriptional regulator [Actinomadura sp. NBRC 104412]|uniref:ATP-binding protein n=1 Tax=Actinomadura sp. NBRC 104412 TaxID=3032203 RepID=UPI0024A31FCF|nr:BTAD domain-containing putative transcriptional regulator [Actinomadura sp. NBRC 104412]GLZ07718.1 SARP family transcriptional regulator [Actinomadura sp. NBRC 104412]